MDWKENFGLPVPETVRQLADGVGLVTSGNTESSDLLSPELNILLWELVTVGDLQVLDWGSVVWQLIGRVLRVLGKFERTVLLDSSLCGDQSSSDQVE